MTTPNVYDQLPYVSHPFRQTHPDRIAALAVLLGLRPPPAETSRVLELGCASGGNLIPMALELPRATFVGVDLSEEQVAAGRETVAALGLTNITLLARDILEIGPDLGTFDYVLCHGVYSWVPAEVQEKIFAIAAEQMVPDGIAYVSYNTFPGWYLSGMLRDIMLYHTRGLAEPVAAVKQAREVLRFLVASAGDHPGPFHQLLRGEVERLLQAPDEYLYHEHLAAHNAPVYFHQFVDQAAAHGLRYVAETDFHAMVLDHLPPESQKAIRQFARSATEVEQYMDFHRNRIFRQSLLCHADRSPSGTVNAARLAGLAIASRIRPRDAAPDLASDAAVHFDGVQGFNVTLHEPFLKTALAILAEEWPTPVPFDALRRRARERVAPGTGDDGPQAGADARRLAEMLFRLFSSFAGLVEFSQAAPVFFRTAGARPTASPLARHQAARGPLVTTLRHEQVQLDELSAVVLPLLDGTRDRAQLLATLADLQRQGRLPLPPMPDGVTPEAWLADCLEGTLRELGRYALLTA